jgi:hypothetical protein
VRPSSFEEIHKDGHTRNDMKKLGGVKKAFDEALEGPPPANTGLQPPPEGDLASLFNGRETTITISFERAELYFHYFF